MNKAYVEQIRNGLSTTALSMDTQWAMMHNPKLNDQQRLSSEACWICTRDENGDQLTSDIVEDKEIPDLNTPIDEAIKVMFRNIVNTAHYCY